LFLYLRIIQKLSNYQAPAFAEAAVLRKASRRRRPKPDYGVGRGGASRRQADHRIITNIQIPMIFIDDWLLKYWNLFGVWNLVISV
jgi:hypothetical protein